MLKLVKSLYLLYKRGIKYEKVEEYDYLILENTDKFIKNNILIPSISSIKLDIIEDTDKVQIIIFYHADVSKKFKLLPTDKYKNLFSLKRWMNIKQMFKIFKERKIEVVIQYGKEDYCIIFPQKRKDV